jgi:mRNA (2'-O-methyladenosine-N6-)-methyltransferase
MSDDELKVLASVTIYELFVSAKISPPIFSLHLLTKVISHSSATRPSFRLTDLSRFESILEDLSNAWNHGKLVISRESPGRPLCVLDIQLESGQGFTALPSLLTGDQSRKRKRVIDEDADSAAGDDTEDTSSFGDTSLASTTLGGLSKELREVYSILQKGTAKGRLLAEQVY